MRARPRRRTRDGLPETAPPRKWETIASAAPISARASGHLSRRCPRLVASRSLSPADAASTAAPSSSGGGSSPRAQARDRAISQRAWPRMVSSVLDSHFTGCSISRCSRSRSARRASSVPNRSGQAEGSSTSCANSTARHAANGRRAHHRCKVEGWPCRILFSRADALLMASSGRETSISFLRIMGPGRDNGPDSLRREGMVIQQAPGSVMRRSFGWESPKRRSNGLEKRREIRGLFGFRFGSRAFQRGTASAPEPIASKV